MTNEMSRNQARRDSGELSPFGRLFDDWFGFGRLPGALMAEVDHVIKPALNVVEGEQSFTITCELPGVAKDDVSITIEGGVLTIAGEKKREEEHKDKSWHRIERVYGSFQRQMTLPKGVDGDKADASFKDGVLRIELPKSEQAKPKQLKVK